MSGFGNFGDLCYRSGTLGVCNVFTEREQPKNCELTGIELGTLRILDPANNIASLIALSGTIYLGYRAHSKYAAVGRKEMILFFMIYFFTLVSQILALGGWRTSTIQPNDPFVVWPAVINTGLVVATAWILLMNAFVGFQIVDDGTWVSMLSIFFSAFALFGVTAFIGADTAYNWTGAFTYSNTLSNTALYILSLIVPAASIGLYPITVTLLVIRTLSQRKPLAYVWGALLVFALGQVFTLVISDPICNGTSRYVDGNVFNTLLTFVAVTMVSRFWSSITEDEWDDFEDQY